LLAKIDPAAWFGSALLDCFDIFALRLREKNLAGREGPLDPPFDCRRAGRLAELRRSTPRISGVTMNARRATASTFWP
jgi:hypothetical protein